ncbi:dynein regulatory complex subunit 2-like [Argonauta hians]
MARGRNKGKSKLTEEQKILQEEQRMILQQELKRKKEELLLQFLKDKYAKEEIYSKSNKLIIDDRWRSILRGIKSSELHSDIMILKSSFERTLDRKEGVFKAILVDIEEAEEQYILALSSHLENIDRLLKLQEERIHTFQLEYNKDLHIIEEEFKKEQDMMLKKFRTEMNNLADIMYAMEQNFIEKEEKAKLDFENLKDEVQNKNLEEKHSLRMALESKVEHLWQMFNQTKAHYQDSTVERRDAFERLKKKDIKSADEIEKQMRKVQRIAEQISNLKLKMAYNAKINDEKNQKLKEEKDKMRFVLQGMKIEMNKLRTSEFDKITRLALDSNAAIKELTKQKEKGERILKLFERCRKMETEKEKIIPFYPESVKHDEDIVHEMNPVLSKKVQKVFDLYKPLNNFWKRFNKVLLDKHVLLKEQDMLDKENEKLKNLMKQYLDGISVNPEVMSKANPLLMVCQEPLDYLMDQNEKGRKSRPEVVEAAHIVKYILP